MQDDLLFLFQQLHGQLEAACSAPRRDPALIDRIVGDMRSVERSLARQALHPRLCLALQGSSAGQPADEPDPASLAANRITSASSPAVNR